MDSTQRSERGTSTGDAPPVWRISVADPASEIGRYRYEVAGLLVESTWALGLPWRAELGEQVGSLGSDVMKAAGAEAGADSRRLIWEGDGWLGGVWRRVSSYQRSEGCEIDVHGFGRATVQAEARQVRLFPADAVFRADPGLSMEVVLGPILALMLAYEGTFCLHAGSVLIDGRAIAFLGQSGIGKSTLSASAGAEWVQLGDDILAVDSAGRSALPRFPQLKLEEQYPVEGEGAVALGGLLALAPFEPGKDSAKEGHEISGEPLSIREATLTLVRHSVAAKLFPPELLGEHLAWCERVARSVELLRWTYPYDLDRLEEVRVAIRAAVTCEP